MVQHEAGMDQRKAPDLGPAHVHVLNHGICRSTYRPDTVLRVESMSICWLSAELNASLFSKQPRIGRVERLCSSVDVGPSGVGIHKQIHQLDAQDALHPGDQLSHRDPEGDNFKVLGVNFDCGLFMADAVHEVVVEVSWELRTLQRTVQYHRDAQLLNLYKARVLGYVEYRTAAVYHATDTVLAPLDRLQDSFLRRLGVAPLEALMVFRLAPLATRRDMAMLGLVHRAALRQGPPQFWKFFKVQAGPTHRRTRLQLRRHLGQLEETRSSNFLEVVRRSALGLVAVYNLLPPGILQTSTVKSFQENLQEELKTRACQGREDWHLTYSPRVPLWRHPLL